METFIIPAKFVFKGVFKVKAKTLEEANNIVDKQCGMGSGEIHAQSSNVDWDFDMTPEKIVESLSDTDPWEEDPTYSSDDWRIEVGMNDTRLGYKDWVDHKKEAYIESGFEE